MKKLFLVLVVISTLICLTACGPRITSGEIYAMEHREETVTVDKVSTVMCAGKVFIPRTSYYKLYYPDRYVIHVQGVNDAGNTITETFYVSKEVYDSLSVGSTFEFDEQRGDMHEEPCDKESISSSEYEEFLKGENK